MVIEPLGVSPLGAELRTALGAETRASAAPPIDCTPPAAAGTATAVAFDTGETFPGSGLFRRWRRTGGDVIGQTSRALGTWANTGRYEVTLNFPASGALGHDDPWYHRKWVFQGLSSGTFFVPRQACPDLFHLTRFSPFEATAWSQGGELDPDGQGAATGRYGQQYFWPDVSYDLISGSGTDSLRIYSYAPLGFIEGESVSVSCLVAGHTMVHAADVAWQSGLSVPVPLCPNQQDNAPLTALYRARANLPFAGFTPPIPSGVGVVEIAGLYDSGTFNAYSAVDAGKAVGGAGCYQKTEWDRSAFAWAQSGNSLDLDVYIGDNSPQFNVETFDFIAEYG